MAPRARGHPGRRGERMPRTGEEPGVGVYVCTRCGQQVRLDDPGDRLPPCPDCRHTEFVRAGTGKAARGQQDGPYGG